MSYIFDVGEETVWSPALRVGDLYVRFLGEIADFLGEPTGLVANASDMYEIDVDAYESLVRKMIDLYFATGSLVQRGLLEGVLAPSVVVLDRAGRPYSPRSDEERGFIARALELPLSR